MKSFALISAAGYVAPRHMKAIKQTGNILSAAYDPHDSVGEIDRYFPDAAFFTEFERFDRHIDMLRRNNEAIDYVSICSPNYLHDSHIRFGLRAGADVICEKPVVLNPWNLDALEQIQETSQKRIYSILQLRLHPSIMQLKREIENEPDKFYDIDLTYITSRGNWYYTSWKGNDEKSGGIATNIGIHFFDMLCWLFGDVNSNKVHVRSHDRASGFLQFKKANVRWFLSINPNTLPQKESDQRTYRSLTIDGREVEFSDGFDDLHTLSYKGILDGEGFGIEDARPSIELVHNIRHSKIIGLADDYHPLAKLPLIKHPFQKN